MRVCATGALVLGCSQTPSLEYASSDDAASGSEASPGADATSVGDADVPSDAAPNDGGADDAANDGAAPRDGGFFCGDAAVTSCAQCSGAPFDCALNGRCAASCKDDCGGSGGDPVECVGCDGGHNAVVYRCVSGGDPAGCLGGGVVRCNAQDGLDECPGPRQVRLNDSCYACGEPNTTGQSCRGGGQCTTNGANAFECR